MDLLLKKILFENFVVVQMIQEFSSEIEGNLVMLMYTRQVLGFECSCMQTVTKRYATCKVRDIHNHMGTD